MTQLSAADRYWDINGVTAGAGGATPGGTWDGVLANWTLDGTGLSATTTWLATDRAVFSAGSDATGPFTVTISGTISAAGALVEEGTVSLASGAISVGTGNITIDPGAVLSIDSTLRITASAGATMTLNGGRIRQTNPSSAGTFLSSNMGIVVGAAGGTVDYTSSGTGTSALYAGTITGVGNTLTKTGTGEFRYQGTGLPNTTYAKLAVNQGLFRLGFASSIQDERGFGAVPVSFTADAITLTGGGQIGVSFNTTLHANRGITLGAGGGGMNMSGAGLAVPGVITGTGGLTVSGAQLLSLTGINDFTGGFTMNGAGNVTVGASGRLSGVGSVTINAGTLTLNNANTTISSLAGAGNLALANSHALTVGDGTSTSFSGVISGSGSVAKVGAGTLTYAGINTYTGPTTITAGRLALGAANRIANASDMVLNGGTFDTGGFSETVDTLSLTANSAIDLGSGASVLAFANSSSLDWSIFTLDIVNWTLGVDSIQVGTDSTGLTTAQLAQLRFVEYGNVGGQIDPSGFITPVPEPSSAAVALLSGGLLYLTVARKRRA